MPVLQAFEVIRHAWFALANRGWLILVRAKHGLRRSTVPAVSKWLLRKTTSAGDWFAGWCFGAVAAGKRGDPVGHRACTPALVGRGKVWRVALDVRDSRVSDAERCRVRRRFGQRHDGPGCAGDREGALQTFHSSWAVLTVMSIVLGLVALSTVWFVPWAHWLSSRRFPATEAARVMLVLGAYVLVGQQGSILESGFRCDGNYALGTSPRNVVRLLEAVIPTVVGVVTGRFGDGPCIPRMPCRLHFRIRARA